MRSLTSLRTLSATHNQIQEVFADFSSLSLWELNLSFNRIERVEHMLSGMTQLRMLNLEGNRVRALPAGLLGCGLLEHLVAGKNPLESMLPSVSGLGAITTVKLSDCKIRWLPAVMAAATSLRVVELDRNQLDAFPAGLCTLKAVATIRLRENFIVNVPPEIGRVPCLTCLDLSGNRVSLIACEVRLLSCLTFLSLADNRLRSLPPFPPFVGPVLGRLGRLETLDVRGNGLDRLPHDLALLRGLKHLALEGNPWRADAVLRRIVGRSPADAANDTGELSVHVLETEAGEPRAGPVDRFVVAQVGRQMHKSQVRAGRRSTASGWASPACSSS